MAPKFTMSDGTQGMLRGQAPNPDAFQRADPNMPRRNYARDTEFEQRAVKPMKSSGNDTGYVSQMADLAMDGVMEQAMADKLTETMQNGIEDGWNARLELEKLSKDDQVSEEQIDAAQDSKNVEDDDLEALRAKRRQQMKDKFDKKLKYQGLGHGSYDEIEEEVFLKTVTASERAVVHFYHRNFEKCKIMDMHLSRIAKKFLGTRVVKMDAEKAPFFVEKLGVRTLPCAVVFNDGIAKGRQVGFEGLGGDEFKTEHLAWKIKEWSGIEEDFEPDDADLFQS